MLDQGHTVAFSFADVMKNHGPGSPGGAAHAFKVLQRALPLLEPDGVPERREIAVRTAFGGPGARDVFECVTRAVTEDRYAVGSSMERQELGTRARFVFELSYRGTAATLVLRDGFVTQEFLDLAGQGARDPEQEAHLTRLKREMAERVMSASAKEVYDVDKPSADIEP